FLLELLVPLWAQAADDLRRSLREALDFALPLVLQGGGANDQDTFDAETLTHDLGGGDGLDRLAQAHFVADQAAARLGGKESALTLIVVKRHAQEFLEGRAFDAARKGLRQALAPLVGVADPGH